MLADGCSMPLNDGVADEHAVEWRAFPTGKKSRAAAKGALAARARTPDATTAAATRDGTAPPSNVASDVASVASNGALPGTPPVVPSRAKGSTRKERSEVRAAARAAQRPEGSRTNSADEAPPSIRKGFIPSAAALEGMFSK